MRFSLRHHTLPPVADPFFRTRSIVSTHSLSPVVASGSGRLAAGFRDGVGSPFLSAAPLMTEPPPT
jgi:hypothetical protein